mmetsp:Transcript_28413/g.48313  ORF Transcript_28413/g.48313 Transcript_28413/m.48313 type:complete len:579 (-) Transcript_28413:86-1822(-)
MKHHKDAIIHGAQLFRHLSSNQPTENEQSLAKLPFAATARTAARALSNERLEEGEGNGDDFFSSAFGFGLGGNGKDKSKSSGDDDFFGAFFGGGNDSDESGGDFFSSFLGGGNGNDESEGGFFSSFLGGGNDMDPESGDDFFSALLGGGGGGGDDVLGMFMQSFEQCGINVGDIAGKAMGAFFMYGSSFDMNSPSSFIGFDTYQPILLALKDDDEEECSDADSASLVSASEEYLKCTGMDGYFQDTDTVFQSIEDDCQPIYQMVATSEIESLQQEALDQDSPIGQSSMRCLKTTLGDNDAGDFIRYEYNNIDKTFECFRKLGEEMPRCVVYAPTEDSKPFSLPLSLLKKLACLLGSNYEMVIEMACDDLHEGLDKCLPQIDEEIDEDNISTCAEEEGILIGKQDALFGMDASVLTGDKIPGFCSRVFEENGVDTTELQSRFEYYNQNREYGWVIESSTKDEKEVVEAIAVPQKDKYGMKSPIPGDFQALHQSNPDVLSSEEQSTWADGEAGANDGYGVSTISFLIAGLVIVAAVLVGLAVKYSGFRAIRVRPSEIPNTTSRKEYAHVGVKMADADFAI